MRTCLKPPSVPQHMFGKAVKKAWAVDKHISYPDELQQVMTLVHESAKAGSGVPWTAVAQAVGVTPSPQVVKEEAIMARGVESNGMASAAGSSSEEALPIPPRTQPTPGLSTTSAPISLTTNVEGSPNNTTNNDNSMRVEGGGHKVDKGKGKEQSTDPLAPNGDPENWDSADPLIIPAALLPDDVCDRCKRFNMACETVWFVNC